MNDSYDAILRSGNRGIYALAVVLSTALGAALIHRDSRSWPLSRRDRILVLAGVSLGALLGCAIPAFFAGGTIEKLAWMEVVTPKTVLGGLLFGFLGAAVVKRAAGISYDTSDAFARGGCLLMAVGRLGCVAQHCCFGRPTDTFLGWDFGDGHPRWPVQAFEAVLLFGLFAGMEVLHRRRLLEHRRLFVLFAAYGFLRFGLEFLRELLAASWMGIGFYQWLALGVAGTGLFQIAVRTRALRERVLVEVAP
jgi:phosphatidylglycerol---prolipoprotein diacylglyceryl transferase